MNDDSETCMMTVDVNVGDLKDCVETSYILEENDVPKY
jgi:hypothetical protein